MSKYTKITGRAKTTKATKTKNNGTKLPSYKEFLADGETELYLDTGGEAMPEPVTKNTAKQSKIDAKFLAKKAQTEKKVRAPKAPQLYTGAPIPATKVYRRDMPEFKNTRAECWMLVNEIEGTTTFANTYGGLLKASYDPTTYTYKTNEKKLAIKSEQMIEVEVTEYPTWIVNAHGTKKSRKSK